LLRKNWWKKKQKEKEGKKEIITKVAEDVIFFHLMKNWHIPVFALSKV
jgi:hypothetical protein